MHGTPVLIMLMTGTLSYSGAGHMFSNDDKTTLQTLYWLVRFYEGKGLHEKAEQIRAQIDQELDDKLEERRLAKCHHSQAA
jgi:hypothetical protein